MLHSFGGMSEPLNISLTPANSAARGSRSSPVTMETFSSMPFSLSFSSIAALQACGLTPPALVTTRMPFSLSLGASEATTPGKSVA